MSKQNKNKKKASYQETFALLGAVDPRANSDKQSASDEGSDGLDEDCSVNDARSGANVVSHHQRGGTGRDVEPHQLFTIGESRWAWFVFVVKTKNTDRAK